MAKAREMNVPQCICIVDTGGQLLAFARMDGAFALSVDTALRKAKTAASYGIPTGDIAAGIDIKLAIATQGKRINLPGGLPIIVDGHVSRRHRRRLRHRRAGQGGEGRACRAAGPAKRMYVAAAASGMTSLCSSCTVRPRMPVPCCSPRNCLVAPMLARDEPAVSYVRHRSIAPALF